MLDLMEVAAEPTRRRLLQLLAGREQTVTELTAEFSVSRSAVSQHLLLLAEVGLVTARKVGRHRFYRLDERGMARLRALFDAFWTQELDLLVTDARKSAPSTTAASSAPATSSPPANSFQGASDVI